MNFTEIPILKKLMDGDRILIAGAGGGFDVFSGLPYYFWLKNQGKQVFLANLSFTNLTATNGNKLSDAVVEVTTKSDGPTAYFPEKYLCQWFESRGESVSIQSFFQVGVKPITEAYKAVCDKLEIDTVLLVDGGTDSLMRGDECGLGTPEEDMASIAAVSELDIPRKFLSCIGFGVDTFHGVCHAQFLESVAALQKEGAFLGTFSLLPEMEEANLYKEAYQFVENLMPAKPSIVSTSILSAVDGEYGDFHANFRTEGSKLWINPLMNIYWSFELDAIVKRCLYLDYIRETETYMQLTGAIESFRSQHGSLRDWESINV